jgi:hypothetical protein
MYVDIPEGSRLITVSAINGITADLEMRVDLAQIGQGMSETEISTLPLLHAYQDALLTVVWTAGQPMNVGNWRRVVVTYFGCTAGDGLAMCVGVEVDAGYRH